MGFEVKGKGRAIKQIVDPAASEIEARPAG